jgi:DNA-binding transcriptional regulator LsrR (DeoR family)
MTKIINATQRWEAQEKITFREFFKQPSTMFQVARRTGIDRANICRFVAKQKRANTIEVVKTDIDPLTGFTAQYLTTNPEYFKNRQLNFFQ